MASRKLSDLHPKLRPFATAFLAKAAEQGIDVLVTCTYRSGAEQDALYQQGRTKAGSIVTNARAGQSKHNFAIGATPASKAFDVVPMLNGKCVWDSGSILWKELGIIGRAVGLDWAGDWKSFKEFPHFQLKE